MQPTSFEIYLCSRSAIVKNGLSDLGFGESHNEVNNIYAIKKEKNGTLWYAKFHAEKEDIIGPWFEILGAIESDDIELLPRYKRTLDGNICGLNRIYLNEIFRQGDEHIKKLKETKAALPA
jgi:hypothetical protein